MNIGIEDHPDFAGVIVNVPPERVVRINTTECPGCGKHMRRVGTFVTVTDEFSEPPLTALAAVCPRCDLRLKNSPTRREKILANMRQSFRLVVECKGNA